MATATMPDEQQQVETQPLDAGHRRRVLEDRVLFLSPTVGRWEGRYKIPPTMIAMEIGGVRVDTSKKGTGVTTPHTVMLNDNWPVCRRTNKSWKKMFNEALTKKDRILAKLSIPFAAVGARIIPMARAKEFFHEIVGLTLGRLRYDLRKMEGFAAQSAGGHEKQAAAMQLLRDRIRSAMRQNANITDATPLYDESRSSQSFARQWEALADEFVRELDDVFTQIKANISPQATWNAVQDRVPNTPVKMRAKFYTNILPVELAGSADTNNVTMADLDEYDSVMRAAVDRTVEAAVEAVIARPRQELAEKLAGLKEVINRDGKVTTKSFRPVREAFEKLRLFEFAANPQLLAEIQSFEQRMRITDPISLDSVTAASNGFIAALDSVAGECENAVQQARDIEEFGKERRAIDLS